MFAHLPITTPNLSIFIQSKINRQSVLQNVSKRLHAGTVISFNSFIERVQTARVRTGLKTHARHSPS